jgi:hypothetical protein
MNGIHIYAQASIPMLNLLEIVFYSPKLQWSTCVSTSITKRDRKNISKQN